MFVVAMAVARVATFDEPPVLQPVSDQRGIWPTRVERWVVDASF